MLLLCCWCCCFCSDAGGDGYDVWDEDIDANLEKTNCMMCVCACMCLRDGQMTQCYETILNFDKRTKYHVFKFIAEKKDKKFQFWERFLNKVSQWLHTHTFFTTTTTVASCMRTAYLLYLPENKKTYENPNRTPKKYYASQGMRILKWRVKPQPQTHSSQCSQQVTVLDAISSQVKQQQQRQQLHSHTWLHCMQMVKPQLTSHQISHRVVSSLLLLQLCCNVLLVCV